MDNYNPNFCTVCQACEPMSPSELLYYGYEIPVCSHECYDKSGFDWDYIVGEEL